MCEQNNIIIPFDIISALQVEDFNNKKHQKYSKFYDDGKN